MQSEEIGFGRLFWTMHDAVVAAEARTGRIRLWNPAAAALFGYTEDEALAMSVDRLVPAYLLEGHRQGRERYGRTGAGAIIDRAATLEVTALRKSGEEVPIELTLSPSPARPLTLSPFDGTDDDSLVVAVMRDVSERRQVEGERAQRLVEQAALEAAAAAERRLVGILENMSDAFFSVDREWRFTYVNAQAARLLQQSRAELLGQNIWLALPALRGTAFYYAMQRAALQLNAVHLEDALFAGDAWLEVRAHPSPEGLAVYLTDISDRKRAEEELERLALYDGLTKLPNRTLLNDRLQQAVITAHRQGDPLALIFLDLDRFKEVNDTFGHHAGDLLLQQVGSRLAAMVGEPDTVARLGGDEFAVILPEASAVIAASTAQRLLSALERPFGVEGYRLDVGASAGVAIFPDHADDAVNLMRYADIAMYMAKRSGGGVAVYTPDADEHSPGRLALLSELRWALEHEELVLHYQPIVHFSTGRVARVEALVRWQHPRYDLMMPDTFVPLAERTGLINALTAWVMRTALRQCRAWRDKGLATDLAVNLSARNLYDPDLPDTIAALLGEFDLPPSSLKLELTESSIMADAESALAVLNRLRAIGVGIAIDDFGTGYSSLSYLKRLPVDEIKIDKSFVLDMAVNENDATIVRSAIELAHNLGLQVVAEGVEDAETWAQLARLGCDAGQAFYVAKPMPADAMADWLARQEAATAAQGRKVVDRGL